MKSILKIVREYVLLSIFSSTLFLPIAWASANHFNGEYPNEGILFMSAEQNYSGPIYLVSNNCNNSELGAYTRIASSTINTAEMDRWVNGIDMRRYSCTPQTQWDNHVNIELVYQQNYSSDPMHTDSYGHNHSVLTPSSFCDFWVVEYPCGNISTVHLDKRQWDRQKKNPLWQERLIMHETGHSHGLDHHCESNSIMNNGLGSCNNGVWTAVMAYQPTDRMGINSIYPPPPPPPPPQGPTYISGNITTSTTWNNLQDPYIVQEDVIINPGVTLTIEPGTIVKFPTTSSGLTVNGTLNAYGTATSTIYFTSIKDDTVGGDTNGDGGATIPAGYDWRHIKFNAGSEGNFNNVVVVYGGSYDPNSNLHIAGGVVNILNSKISNSGGGGIFQDGGVSGIDSTELSYSSIGFVLSDGFANLTNNNFKNNANNGYGVLTTTGGSLTLINNSFTDNAAGPGWLDPSTSLTISGNTTIGGVYGGFILEGVVTGSSTLPVDLPYMPTTVTVAQGGTLNINPGTIIKFTGGNSSFIVNGTLNIQGSSILPIYLTSTKDDSIGGDTNRDGALTSPDVGNWKHIIFNNGSIGNITNTIIRYGGNDVFLGSSLSNIYNNGGNLSISDLSSSYSLRGLYQSVGTTTISSSDIFQNGTEGVYIEGGMMTLLQNNIYNNNFGLRNTTSTNIPAENNYWGNSSGPYHPVLNPGGLGNGVSDNVDFTPWLLGPF